MKLFRRENYLSKIRGFYNDTGIIKVITGTRRCGKSSLMHTIAEELVENGVDEGTRCENYKMYRWEFKSQTNSHNTF